MPEASPQPPRRFKAEKLDKVLFLVRRAHDSLLHCVITFACQLDAERLEKAVRLSLQAEEILACRFINGKWRQYWETRPDLDQLDVVRLIQTKDLEGDVGNYLATPIAHLDAPLIQVRIFRSTIDTLCLKINHMVADAGGVKDYMTLLASIYRNLAKDPNYRPAVNTSGNRSPNQLWQHFSFSDRLKILRRGFRDWQNELFPPRNWCYPFRKAPLSGRKFIIHRIDPARYRPVKKYAQQHGVTLNDIMVAAFLRSLHEILRPAFNVPMRLGTTVDLRRYLPNRKALGICNLSGVFKLNFGTKLGESIRETVQLVHDRMQEHKADYLGLGDSRYFMFGELVPHPWAVWAFHKVKRLNQMLSTKEVSPALTNMGIISREQVNFGDAPVVDAFLTPPLVLPPLFLIGLSGFEESLTASLGFCESGIPQSTVVDLLNNVESQLAKLTGK